MKQTTTPSSKPTPPKRAGRVQAKPKSKAKLSASPALLHLYCTKDNQPENYLSADLLRQARSCGYKLESVNMATIADLDKARQQWVKAGVRGVILTEYYNYAQYLQHNWDDLAVVCCGGGPAHGFHLVQEDVSTNTKTCLEKAVACGRKRLGIAFQHHEPQIGDDAIRYEVAERWLEKEGRVYADIPLLRIPISQPIAFIDWYRRHRPEVLIGFVGGLIMWMLNDLGVHLGQEVLFINPTIRDKNEEFAGIMEDNSTLAKTAVTQLHDLINAGEFGLPKCPSKQIIPGTWRYGKTYPAP